MGEREYLGCVGLLAVAALLSGTGVLAVAGAVASLFIVPVVLIVGGGVRPSHTADQVLRAMTGGNQGLP